MTNKKALACVELGEKEFSQDIKKESRTMEEKKLTDDEIVNAYIHCVLKRGDCDNCPYEEVGCGVDGNDLIKIINCQKAEIKRLTEELKYYRGELQ
jgi:hypothetical protein